jgi:NAD(P)H-dependent FMN reductase
VRLHPDAVTAAPENTRNGVQAARLTGPARVPTLQIIIASTRPGRFGLPIGQWFAGRARTHGAFEIDFADLAEINLPMLDEPNHPRLREYTKKHTKDWSARVEAADAFVMVVAEYNFGYPAPIKNAIDFVYNEWMHKPVGFVSYGGIAAGTRSVQQLKQVVTSPLNMYPVSTAVAIPSFRQFIDEDGVVVANEVMEKAADAMLDELVTVERALRGLRGL